MMGTWQSPKPLLGGVAVAKNNKKNSTASRLKGRLRFGGHTDEKRQHRSDE